MIRAQNDEDVIFANLEVEVVRQVLEAFRDNPDVSLAAKTRRVIDYATFDA